MNRLKTSAQDKWLYFFIAFAVAVNFSGFFVTIMGPDAALYAMVSKTMVLRHDYVNLYYHGADWLDKPHFPFWVTALCFNLFGFTTWAYKLPGILFLLMGAYYTYMFAKSLYNRHIALWSVLILLTAQHIVLSDNDVRAEPYLTGLIIAAVYHFHRANQTNNYGQIVIGSLFTACAIMTKGMLAIVPIGGAIAGQLLITAQRRRLFSWKWLVAFALTSVFILPEIWCLYLQFDLHLEKVVFGHTGVSGIRFFFWDSQIGRFFNTGPIKGHGDPFFFVHTTLWAFLPWSLLLFAAIFQFFKKGRQEGKTTEWYCISGALLTFLLFSASRFQLPHYLNIVFPFFAIVTAQYLYNIEYVRSMKWIIITQYIVIALLVAAIVTLQYFFRPQVLSIFTIITLVLLLLIIVLLPDELSGSANQKVILKTVLISFFVNLYLNLSFYPSLLKYQGGSEAAFWINQHNPQHLPVVMPDGDFTSEFEFYNNAPVTFVSSVDNDRLPAGPFIFYGDGVAVQSLINNRLHPVSLVSFDRYRITRLRPSFLNQKTRGAQLIKTTVNLVN